MTYGLGWIPDDADDRDHVATFGAATPPPDGDLGDLGHLLPAILNQGRDNSCVAQSVATVVYSARVPHETSAVELLSRKALWWLGRHESGKHTANTGMQLRTAFRVMNSLGFCRERHWSHGQPYDKRPAVDSARMMIDQRNRSQGRVVYERLGGMGAAKLAEMRAAIAAGRPFAFGVDVSSDFAANNFDASQPVEPPVYDIAGGHAMVAYGYRGDGAFRVRNSWGHLWGDRGCCWLSSDYMLQASDCWTVPSAPPFSDTP